MSVYLANQQLIPEDRVQKIFEDVFDLPISTATLEKINVSFAQTIMPKQTEVLENLKIAPVKH